MAQPDDVRDVAAACARAEGLIAVHRPSDAVATLLAVGAPHVGPPRSAFLLAQAHLAERQPDLARGAAELGLSRAPNDEWGLRLRAIALSGVGRHREAIDAGLAAVDARPSSAPAHLALGDVCLAARRPREATVPSEAALALAPQDPNVHVLAGRIALRRMRLKEARQHFEAALAIDPEHAVARNNLGVVDLRTFRSGRARKHFLGSARIDPRGPGAPNVELANRARRSRWWLVLFGAVMVIGFFQDHDLLFPAVLVATIVVWRTGLVGRLHDRIRPPQAPRPSGTARPGPPTWRP